VVLMGARTWLNPDKNIDRLTNEVISFLDLNN
jgi:hypothetical protein